MSEALRDQDRWPGAAPERARRWLLPVLLWPLLLLWPCVFGDRTFLPYDLAQAPPASLLRTPGELAAMRAESNFDVTEPPVWFVPELQRARRSLLEEHALPNWHPTARTGTALLPHGHDAMLYPPVWPALLSADPASRLGLVALLDLWIAGLLMFGFLRSLRLAPAAAALGALAFAASSTLAANAHNYPRLASLVWLPGMLWALRAAADRHGRARRLALCGFVATFALTWCAGFPPYAVPASLLAGCYALHLGIAAWRGDRRHGLQLLAAFGTAMALGIALAAIYLLPAFAFFGSSARPLAPDLERLSLTTLDPFGLLGYLAPDLFGRPDLQPVLPYDRSPLVLLWSWRDRWSGGPLGPNFNATEYALFGGALAFWLAVAGLGDRAARHRWFPLVALLLLWALAMFVVPLCFLFVLPGVRVAPPLRYVGPCCLLLAWLAAQGCDCALRGGGRRLLLGAALALGTALLAWWFALRIGAPGAFADWGLAEHVAARFAPLANDPAQFTPAAVTAHILHAPDGNDYVAQGTDLAVASATRAGGLHAAAALLLFLLFAAARRRSLRGLAIAGALLLTGGELMLAARTFDGGIARRFSDWTPVHDFLVEQRQAAAAQGGFMIARAAARLPDGSLPPPSAPPPGPLGPHGIRDLQVYTFYDKRSADPLNALFARLHDPSFRAQEGYAATCLPDDAAVLQHPLLDLLGVRYVLAAAPLQHAGERIEAERTHFPGGDFYVYERPSALPRAFVLARMQAYDADETVLRAMTDPAFAPRDVVYADRLDLAAAGAFTADAAAGARTATFVVDATNKVGIEVGDGPAGWLLLTDTWMPGWSATIDGEPAPLLRADHCFRAVPVGAGRHTVVFRYVPPGQRTGALVSAFAALVLLLVAWRARTSRPTTEPAETST